MLRLLTVTLVLLLLGVIGYRQLGEGTTGPRQIIESGLAQARSTRNLSAPEEELLRVQLALSDYITKNGTAPETLTDLVPVYFDEVPVNSQTGNQFQYKSEGATYRLGEQIEGKKAKPAIGTGKKLGVEKSTQEKTLEEMFGEDFVNPNTMKKDDFVYDPSGKRDPFRPFDFSPKLVRDGPLTPLERYSVGQLRLTAVLSSPNGAPTAIVEDSAGKGFTVRKGTKIGNQGGVVMAIEADTIKILETHVAFTGEKSNKVVEMKINRPDGDK